MNDYPPDWPEISKRTKDEAAWRCVRCDHLHDIASGYMLTVHHLDGDKTNRRWWNLVPLCQGCHLSIQGRVKMDQPFIFEHSEWFKPYVAGFYAFKYLGEDLGREEVKERIDELLDLGRVA